MTDQPVKVEVILLSPVKIDGKIFLPQSKPILVTPEMRDELVASRAVMADHIAIVTADEPGQFAQDVAAEAEAIANSIVDAAVDAAVEKALAAQAGELAAAQSEAKAVLTTLAEAENEVAALRTKLAAYENVFAAQEAKNTEAAKTTTKKVQAAKG